MLQLIAVLEKPETWYILHLVSFYFDVVWKVTCELWRQTSDASFWRVFDTNIWTSKWDQNLMSCHIDGIFESWKKSISWNVLNFLRHSYFTGFFRIENVVIRNKVEPRFSGALKNYTKSRETRGKLDWNSIKCNFY